MNYRFALRRPALYRLYLQHATTTRISHAISLLVGERGVSTTRGRAAHRCPALDQGISTLSADYFITRLRFRVLYLSRARSRRDDDATTATPDFKSSLI